MTRLHSVVSACEEQSNVSATITEDMNQFDSSVGELEAVNSNLQTVADDIYHYTGDFSTQISRFKY